MSSFYDIYLRCRAETRLEYTRRNVVPGADARREDQDASAHDQMLGTRLQSSCNVRATAAPNRTGDLRPAGEIAVEYRAGVNARARHYPERGRHGRRADAGRQISLVRLEVGRLSGVVPDAMEFCYELVISGTPLEGSTLVIEQTPGAAHCRSCGQDFALDDLISSARAAVPRCN